MKKELQNIKPLVSVVITTYNRSEYLNKTLSSILNQTYKAIEILLIDDGSDKKVALKNEKFAARFSKCTYYYKPNTGQPDSRNFGIKKAKGQYIAFCDDDDYWTLDKLEKQVKILVNRAEFGVVSGWVELIDSKGNKIGKQKRYTGYNKGWLFYKNLERNCLSSATPLLRREVFDKVGFFNTNFTIGEDWEFWRRTSYYYKFYAIESVIAFYRYHGQNMTSLRENNPIERILLYRKLTISLLNWGKSRFSKEEKKKIRDYEWKFYRKILVNHFPSLPSKIVFYVKVITRSFYFGVHLVYLFLFSKKVKSM